MIAAKDSPLRYHGVMVSSTFTDLERHRAALIKAIKGQGLTDVAMENDTAKADADVIDSSLQMVRDASAYVCLIGKKYGQMPACPIRNPGKVSVTELEFNEALRLERPILLFIMGEEHLLRAADFEINAAKIENLNAFRERAKQMKAGSTVHRVYATFNTLEDFTSKAIGAVAGLRRYLDGLDQIDGADTPATQPVTPTQTVHLPQRPAPRHRSRGGDRGLASTAPRAGLGRRRLGLAGRGKSTLALEYVTAIRTSSSLSIGSPARVEASCRWPVSSPGSLGSSWRETWTPLFAELNEACRRKRCLLVLDNLEDDVPGRLIAGGRASGRVTTRLSYLPFLSPEQTARSAAVHRRSMLRSLSRGRRRRRDRAAQGRRAVSFGDWSICPSASQYVPASFAETYASPSKAWQGIYRLMPLHCSGKPQARSRPEPNFAGGDGGVRLGGFPAGPGGGGGRDG